MKRLIIIFGITLILLCIILFSKSKYLGVYEKYITIFYDFPLEEGYEWSYSLDNEDSLKLEEEKDTPSWKFKANKNGVTNLIFEYKNEEKVKYKIVYELEIKDNIIYWTKGEGYGMSYYPDPI